MEKKSVLFLCSGNSCRSQIAEALVNATLGDGWKAFSAGVQPAGYVHPLAIEALKEIGIDHRGDSKSVTQFQNQSFDLVITVCDDAAENCPVWLGKGKKIHISFPDPAKTVGSREVQMEAFRQVRDDMLRKIPTALKYDERENIK